MAEYNILIVCTFTYVSFVKTYIFLFFRFLIKKGTGIDLTRRPLLVIIHTKLQVNWFYLISINLGVKFLYQINEITGCFFRSDISNIYPKRFLGNFWIIPRIYKCEAFPESFKFVNQICILNQFFVTVSSNILNPEKNHLVCRQNFW